MVPFGTFAQDTLWLARGEWTHIPDSVQALRFNANDEWSGVNATLTRPVEAASSLVVVNLDSIAHTWRLEAEGELDWGLAALDTIALELPALPAGAYRFGLTDEIGRVMGASGQLQIGLEADYAHFHWNLGDWSVERMAAADIGLPIDWDEPYVPEPFPLNELDIFPGERFTVMIEPDAGLDGHIGCEYWNIPDQQLEEEQFVHVRDASLSVPDSGTLAAPLGFPNPTHSEITWSGPASLCVFDAAGNTVFCGPLNQDSLHVSDWANGFYTAVFPDGTHTRFAVIH